MSRVPRPAERIDYSGLPLAKPARAARDPKTLTRTGRIKPNEDRIAARREEQFGLHGQIIEACFCCVTFPEKYRTPAALEREYMRAAREVAAALASARTPVKRSHPHHTWRTAQGGTAADLIPIDPKVHLFAIHGPGDGDPNAYLLAQFNTDGPALAAKLWALYLACVAGSEEA